MGKKGWVALWLAGLLLLGQTEQFLAVPADGTAAISQQRYVALTFDDGPKRETTARLLDGLRERGASATFFLIGRQIPDQRDLVERMKAEGHQVGNHTWTIFGWQRPQIPLWQSRKSKKRIRCCGRSWGMGPIGFARLTAQFKMHRNRRFRCLWSLGQWIPGIGSP